MTPDDQPRRFTARWVFPVAEVPLERGVVTVQGARIVAVEPERCPTLARAFEAGRPVDAEAEGIPADSLGPRRVGELMFPIAAGLVFAASFTAFFLPVEGAVGLRAARGDWRALLHNRAFVRFLCFSLIAHFLMHGPMWLFPLFVRSRGGDLGTIRDMWVLMLLVEIPLVLMTGSGLKRLGARGLLAVGMLVAGWRWTLSALISDPTLLFAVQALHGVTVVGLNLGSPLYLDAVAPEKLRSTAQGILFMVGNGIAGIASNLASGWLIDRSGIDPLYLICGIGALALGILSPWILPAAERRDQEIKVAVPGDSIA